MELLAPLAVASELMSWPVVHRASVRALTSALKLLIGF